MEYADAVIAVSSGMKDAILDAYPRIAPEKVHVVLNGIDTQQWQPRDEGLLEELGVDRNRPIAAFVGRLTRQKGVQHLLKAAAKFDPSIQLILCAAAPVTPEIAQQTQELVAALSAERDAIVW